MAKRSILVSVAERSGDAHTARLVREVQRRAPDVEFRGFGGDMLAAAGCRIDLHTVGTASMALGFLSHLGSSLDTLRKFDQLLRDERPDAVLLVDAPGLHFLLARLARWRGVRVAYYICPQVWAWAPWRRGKILRYTDLLLPILPFESRFLQNDRVPVVPVGHPLGDSLAEWDSEGGVKLRAELGIGDGVKVIGLLPGSRTHEIETHTSIFRRILDGLELDAKRHRVLVSCARPDFRPLIESGFAGSPLTINILDTASQVITQASDFVLVASGTASLEVAYFEKPMAVLYRSPWWIHALRNWLFLAPHFTLPNLLSGNESGGAAIVPEHLCRGHEGKELTAIVRPLLDDTPARAAQIAHLQRIKATVLQPGASARAATALMEFLG